MQKEIFLKLKNNLRKERLEQLKEMQPLKLA